MKLHLSSVLVALILFANPVHANPLKSYNGDIKQPQFSLKDLSGKIHRLSDYKNQIVLVQFWATYCTPCRIEMPSMNRLQKKLADKPFKILAIDMAESVDEVKAFVEQVKPEFTILMDEDGEALQQWKVFAAPASFIIDLDGEIKYTLYGGVEWDSKEIVDTINLMLINTQKGTQE